MDKIVQYLKRFYLRLKYYRYGWTGDYATWKEALDKCGGYHAPHILEKVKAATLKVKNGEAAYERDSVLFNKVAYSWPLLANLLWIAGMNNNTLSVIDFGGSLGSSYYQNRFYFKNLKKVTWSVVEQQNFVAAGKKEIAGDELDFFDTVDIAIAEKGPHQLLLLSSVLPYIEKPFELLNQLADKNIPYIIIEETYYNPKPYNRITIQKVPPFYYEATYPAWFLNYNEVIDSLSARYEVLAEYQNDNILYLEGEKIPYRGFILKIKT